MGSAGFFFLILFIANVKRRLFTASGMSFITLHDFGSVSTVSLGFYSSANYFQPCAFSPGLTHHSDSYPHHSCGLLFRKWAHDDTLRK